MNSNPKQVELIAVKKTISNGKQKFNAWVLDTRSLPESNLVLKGQVNDKS